MQQLPGGCLARNALPGAAGAGQQSGWPAADEVWGSRLKAEAAVSTRRLSSSVSDFGVSEYVPAVSDEIPCALRATRKAADAALRCRWAEELRQPIITRRVGSVRRIALADSPDLG